MAIEVVILILILLFALEGNSKKTEANKKRKPGYSSSARQCQHRDNHGGYNYMSRPDGAYGSNGYSSRYGRPYWEK
jgi:hypothetical protein